MSHVAQEQLIAELHAIGVIRTGDFVLKDGRTKRQQAGADVLADAGLRLHSVLSLSAILDRLEATAAIAAADAARARAFIGKPRL